MEKYFGSIAPSKKPPEPVETVEPPQLGERRIEVEYDANPEIAIGWVSPAGGGVDKEVFDVIASLLTRGRTSRLYKSLVVDKQLATNISASSDFTRFPDLFTISATPKAPHTTAEVEAAIYVELEKLKNEGPTERELEKVRNQLDADYIRGMQSNLGMAFRLEDMQALTGDWTYIMKTKELRAKVGVDDVKRVVGKYLTQEKRTVATLVKPKQTADSRTGDNQGGAK
jgi:predicted Zn-dependent peptidase